MASAACLDYPGGRSSPFANEWFTMPRQTAYKVADYSTKKKSLAVDFDRQISKRPTNSATEITMDLAVLLRLGHLFKDELVPFAERKVVKYVPSDDLINILSVSINGATAIQRLMANFGGYAVSAKEAGDLARNAMLGALDRYGRYLRQQGYSGEISVPDEHLLVRAIATRLGHVHPEQKIALSKEMVSELKQTIRSGKLCLKSATVYSDNGVLVFAIS